MNDVKPALRKSNDAAERLRRWIAANDIYQSGEPRELLGAALATERLAVVDFLIDRHGCRDSDMGVPCSFHAAERDAVLDAELEG